MIIKKVLPLVLVSFLFGGCTSVWVVDPTVACSPNIGEYRQRAVVTGQFGPYYQTLKREVTRGCISPDVALHYGFTARQEAVEFETWRGQNYTQRHEGWSEEALMATYGRFRYERAWYSRSEYGPNGTYTKEYGKCVDGSCTRLHIFSNKEGKTGSKR